MSKTITKAMQAYAIRQVAKEGLFTAHAKACQRWGVTSDKATKAVWDLLAPYAPAIVEVTETPITKADKVAVVMHLPVTDRPRNEKRQDQAYAPTVAHGDETDKRRVRDLPTRPELNGYAVIDHIAKGGSLWVKAPKNDKPQGVWTWAKNRREWYTKDTATVEATRAIIEHVEYQPAPKPSTRMTPEQRIWAEQTRPKKPFKAVEKAEAIVANAPTQKFWQGKAPKAMGGGQATYTNQPTKGYTQNPIKASQYLKMA